MSQYQQAAVMCAHCLASRRYLWALLPVVLGFNLACLLLRLVSGGKTSRPAVDEAAVMAHVRQICERRLLQATSMR